MGLESALQAKAPFAFESPDTAQFWETEIVTRFEFENPKKQDSIIQHIYEQCADAIGAENSSFFLDRDLGARNVDTLITLEGEFTRAFEQHHYTRLRLYMHDEDGTTTYGYRIEPVPEVVWASPPLDARLLEHDKYMRHIIAFVAGMCMRYLGKQEREFSNVQSAVKQARTILNEHLFNEEPKRMLILQEADGRMRVTFENVSYLQHYRH